MKGLGTRRSPPWARLGCRLLFFPVLSFRLSHRISKSHSPRRSTLENEEDHFANQSFIQQGTDAQCSF